MTLSVRLLCDQTNRYGTCAATSPPARDIADCVRQAAHDGWHHRPGRDGRPDQHLCPDHAGSTTRSRP